jgi:hypothetical protein
MHQLYRRALLGLGRRPSEISHFPGHFERGGFPAATLPPRLRHGLTEAPSSISPLRLAPQEGSLLIGGRDMQRKGGEQRREHVSSRLADLG